MILVVFFVFFTKSSMVFASYVTIDNKGALVFDKVLSSETDGKDISIKKLQDSPASSLTDAKVLLNKDNGKLTLNVQSKLGNTTSDVTSFRDNIVEIEERGDVKKIQIGFSNDKFSISQNGFTVYTSYPIEVDSKEAAVLVHSPSGVRNLSILPYDAITYVVRSNIISKTAPTVNSLQLSESDKGELFYAIDGVKGVNLFNVYKFDVPVKTTVSATNGHVLSVDEPIWYKVFGFVFG